jgi:hypothetical protein
VSSVCEGPRARWAEGLVKGLLYNRVLLQLGFTTVGCNFSTTCDLVSVRGDAVAVVAQA